MPAYLEAPVWRFALPPGMCGERAVLGLMLPSVDKAGRYFPLTFAALHPRGIAAASGDAWLDVCESGWTRRTGTGYGTARDCSLCWVSPIRRI